MTDQRAALLQAVLDEPTDDAPRLVFADHLLASDDPRGELIIVEHRVLSQSNAKLWARRNALRRAHAATWWPELLARFVRSRCGFAEALAVRPQELATVAPMFAREPIRELEIYGDPLEPDAVAALPRVPRLVARTATTEGFAALLDSPLAATVESVDVAGAAVHGADLRNCLPACKRLVVAHCGFWIDDLLGWEHLGGLHELDISLCDVDADELAALLARTPELRILRASGNPFGGAGDVFVRALPRLANLTRLDVIESKLPARSVREMREAAPAVTVETERGDVPCTIDLGGQRIELVPELGDGEWHVRVDGVRRRIRFEAIDGSSGISMGIRTEVDTANLQVLADAITRGWPRAITPSGAYLEAQSSTGWTIVLIERTDELGPIEILIRFNHPAGL